MSVCGGGGDGLWLCFGVFVNSVLACSASRARRQSTVC